MKEALRRSILLVVIFSLATVLVGSVLSFHTEHISDSQTSITSNFDSKLSFQSEKASADDQDPCDLGFCHLGHCAKLIIVQLPLQSLGVDFHLTYFSTIQIPVERSLDSPFQPPRAA